MHQARLVDSTCDHVRMPQQHSVLQHAAAGRLAVSFIGTFPLSINAICFHL